MLIITAPGQGAQTPGFLAPWLELPGVTERLGAASELAGCDLIRLGTTRSAGGDKDPGGAPPAAGPAGDGGGRGAVRTGASRIRAIRVRRRPGRRGRRS